MHKLERKRATVGVTVVAIVVLAIGIAWRAGLGKPPCRDARAENAPSATLATGVVHSPASRKRGHSRPHPAPAVAPPSPSPTIQQVLIDKSTACRGEPITVEVLSERPGLGTAALVTWVDGKVANPAVLSFTAAGKFKIPVVVYDRSGVGQPARRELEVTIRNCDAHAALDLEVHYLAERGLHSLVARRPARVRQGDDGRAALDAAIFSWDFGDGTQSRGGASVEHRYADAADPAALRTFVVNVEANLHGTLLRGKQSVTLHSEYAANKQRGVITPEVRVRAPTVAGGEYRARMEVTSFESSALRLDNATIHFAPCEGGDSDDERRTSGAAKQYLSTDTVAPGRSEIELSFPASQIPSDTCLVQFTFDGRAASEEHIYLTAHLTVAAEAPGAARRETDPEQIRALTRAFALLGRDARSGATVTEEEIDLLRRRGQL